jgi:hypothetical protein
VSPLDDGRLPIRVPELDDGDPVAEERSDAVGPRTAPAGTDRTEPDPTRPDPERGT